MWAYVQVPRLRRRIRSDVADQDRPVESGHDDRDARPRHPVDRSDLQLARRRKCPGVSRGNEGIQLTGGRINGHPDDAGVALLAQGIDRRVLHLDILGDCFDAHPWIVQAARPALRLHRRGQTIKHDLVVAPQVAQA